MRMFIADSTDKQPKPHAFLEVEPDNFVEVDEEKINKWTPKQIRAGAARLVAREKTTSEFSLKMSLLFLQQHTTNLKLVGTF